MSAERRDSMEILTLELEKSRISREKSLLILNKSVYLYLLFLFIAVMGFINGFVSSLILNLLVVMGMCVLIIGVIPYLKTISREESNLDDLIRTFRGKR